MPQPVDVRVLADGLLRLDDWLPYQCSVITNRVSSMLARMYSEEFGIGVVEWRLIANLGARTQMSAKELALSTAMDPVSITRAVSVLVKKRLVSKRIDASDRRKVIIKLSKTGQTAYAQVVPLAKAIEAELIAEIPPDALHTAHAVLDSLVRRANVTLNDDRDWRDFVAST